MPERGDRTPLKLGEARQVTQHASAVAWIAVAVFVPFDDAESGWGFSPDTWCEHCDAWVFVCPHVGGWSEEDAVWHLRRRRAELGHTPAAPCGDSSFAVDVSVDPRWL